MFAQSGCGKAVITILGDVLVFSEVARAVEVPHENPSSRAPGCFIAELPDNPRDNRELSTQAATGTPADPFWGLPPSPGFLPELQCGLSQLHPVVPTVTEAEEVTLSKASGIP